MALGHITPDELPLLNSEELYLLQDSPNTTTTQPDYASYFGESAQNIENSEDNATQQNQSLDSQQTSPLVGTANLSTSQSMNWLWILLGLGAASLLVGFGIAKRKKAQNAHRE